MSFITSEVRRQWKPVEGSRLDKVLREVEGAVELSGGVQEQRVIISGRIQELQEQLANVDWRDGLEGASRHSAALVEMKGLEMVMGAIKQRGAEIVEGRIAAQREAESIISVLQQRKASIESSRRRWGDEDYRTVAAVKKYDRVAANYLEDEFEVQAN